MSISLPRRPKMTANALLLLVVAFIVLALNSRFWSIVFESPGLSGFHGVVVLFAVGCALAGITLLALLPLSLRWTFRPGLALMLVAAAGASYFMTRYGAVIDRHALASVYETDAREATEWLNLGMVLMIVGLGAIPAAALWWVDIDWKSGFRELFSRLKLLLLAGALIVVAALSAGKDVASLVRNRTELRHIANPLALISANLSYLDHARGDSHAFEKIGEDARRGIALAPTTRPVVLVLAVGESARAESFSASGYARPTDAEMLATGAVYFRDVRSCGTNTATSLPCMFSGLGRKDYEDGVAKYRENLLDVLKRGGYDVVWLDNNTGSKYVAKRMTEVFLADGKDPKLCNPEGCYDQVLVDELRKRLPAVTRDTVFVIHMLGSHGPAYYARYPAEFAKFTPECRSNALQQCSDAQLHNTYDNTIAYTNHILAQTVAVLRDDARIDPALLFLSDHGESLGEKGLYLHGAPYAIAPDEQTHVPMMLWASDRFATRRGVDLACTRSRAGAKLSHDNYFHTTLALADVKSNVYSAELDALKGCLK